MTETPSKWAMERAREEALWLVWDGISEGEWGDKAVEIITKAFAQHLDAARDEGRRDEARSVAGACEESMRALACYLGVGGYNTDTFDANVFHQKIRDGIDMATVPIRQFIERASKAEARAERAEKVVERVRNPSAAARAAMSEALDRWYAVGTQRIPFRLPASAFYPVARALYDAATAHAKPADTPQADIVGGEASEGGGGKTTTEEIGR